MRWIPLGILFSLLAAEGAAQQEVDHTRVRRFMGEEVTVEGPVARVAPDRRGNLWISIGAPHPRASLVIVVRPQHVSGLGARGLEGATVKVTGWIQPGEPIFPVGGIDRFRSPFFLAGIDRSRFPSFMYLEDLSRLQVVTRPSTVPDTGARIPPR